MPVPSFLSSSYRHTEISTDDVQDIIDTFRAEVLTYGNPAWTESSTNNFVSPAGDFKVVFGRVSQQLLRLDVYDWSNYHFGDRGMLISSGMKSPVDIFTGEYHMWICTRYDGTVLDFLGAGILDQSPAAKGTNVFYVFASGSRTGAGADTSYNDPVSAYMRDGLWAHRGISLPQGFGNGKILTVPAEMLAKDLDNDWFVAGRMYQALGVYRSTSSSNPYVRADQVINVPIAPGVLGTFKVLNANSLSSLRISLAVRIA